MRTNRTARRETPNTVAAVLDAMQDRQRAARDDLEAAKKLLEVATANLDAADDELVRVARILGLPVEG